MRPILLRNGSEGPLLFGADMRHATFLVRDAMLYVSWTQAGHAPERILLSTIDLAGDWSAWSGSAPQGWAGAYWRRPPSWFNGVPPGDQAFSIGPPYVPMFSSRVTSVRFSSLACATSILSKGSL